MSMLLECESNVTRQILFMNGLLIMLNSVLAITHSKFVNGPNRNVISYLCIDESDIMLRKNSLCGVVDNVLCYLINRNSVIKQ